ncbi:hypothetical protein [Variovorax arabinosiphilus]|uniref:hypothetical protein n=1 Tax=Variovorax arabinosiphilus TaxID=3053498 RepID=UPI0025778651|nr:MULTISPECIES: hypothetical protein [unclassified Variovorax]MDM0123304.1 hypothetical protein [Variovorax sp. J2L1-78]MDM0131700.1 hypothetical protein [Variovorax sp. J2L1-63]MDM0236067.1 hypothetical protein [Variovorax sp. J2R1-6]
MSSIGVLVRASQEIEELDADWLPLPLGTRPHVHAVIYELTGVTTKSQRFDLRPKGIALELEVGDDEPPMSVTASGVFDEAAVAILKKLCTALAARLYDSEEGRFII